MEEWRELVISEAQSWLGTPWHHEGRIKGKGVDCAMFVYEVFIKCNLIPRFELFEYSEQWALHRSEEKFLKVLERYGRQTNKSLPGNVIIFKYGRCFSHGGIIVNWPIIIHAFKHTGCVVYEDVLCSGFKNRKRLIYEVGL